MSVHLMVRSAYTLLKSSFRTEEIVNEAGEARGMRRSL